MRRIKQLKGWGIYQNNTKEQKKYGFAISVIHPDNMEYYYLCSPSDSDIELETLEQAIDWIENY